MFALSDQIGAAIDEYQRRKKLLLTNAPPGTDWCITHDKPVDKYGFCYTSKEDKPPEDCIAIEGYTL